jgi:pimeloyl-ACP methyl ester carboxylesterase
MGTLERDGVRLHYRVLGTGSPVLFVHSATSTGDHDWGNLAEALSGSHRCILPDLRSHGASDHLEGALGLDEVLADLQALIASEGLERPDVIGFSFGAEVALELEVRFPGTAASLTLLSPGTGHSRGVPQAEQMATWWPRSLRDLHAERHGPDHWKTILTTLSTDARGRPQLSDEVLASIACPMLLIVGASDQRRRVDQARHLAEVNHRARLVLVDDVGHAVHAKAPAVVEREVKAFLAAAANPGAPS